MIYEYSIYRINMMFANQVQKGEKVNPSEVSNSKERVAPVMLISMRWVGEELGTEKEEGASSMRPY